MRQIHSNSPAEAGAVPAIPADIAEWLGAVRLTQLTTAAAQSQPGTSPTDGASPAPSSNHLALLRVFTYGLARGVGDSEELERRARQEPALRHLCGSTAPTAVVLRNFRRRHAGEIESALARVLGACWEGCEGAEQMAPVITREARSRLRESVRADSLAQDN